MENMCDTIENMEANAPSVDDERLESENAAEDVRGRWRRRCNLKFIGSMALLYLTIFVVSMLGGYCSAGAFNATVEAVDSIFSYMADCAGLGDKQVDMAPAVPVEIIVPSADDLLTLCSNSSVDYGRDRGSCRVGYDVNAASSHWGMTGMERQPITGDIHGRTEANKLDLRNFSEGKVPCADDFVIAACDLAPAHALHDGILKVDIARGKPLRDCGTCC